MDRARRLMSCIVFVAALALSSHCGAQSKLGYVGFAFGKSDTTFDSGASSGSGSVRNKSGGVFAGYDFTPYLGIQGAWWWLASQDQAPIAVGNVIYSGATRDVEGWSLGGAATWPVSEKLKLTGRLGAFFWKAETTVVTFLFNEQTLSKDNGVSLTYGVGARFDLGQFWGLRLDYDAFEKIDQSRIQMLTVGAYVRF